MSVSHTNEKLDYPHDVKGEAVAEPRARHGSVAGDVVETIEGHSHDADVALAALNSLGDIDIDEATNKRLLRKIDLNLMPVLCIVYGLNYLDKTTLSYASVMGIRTDIHLVGQDYSWLSSMFYFGYLFWEYPTSRLLQRMPLGKYSAINVFMWGLILALFATVKNFAGAMIIRTFLGVFESAVTPGFALLTSQWYTKREQGLRIGVWFSFNGFAQIFGGLVAYGIARGRDKHGFAIEAWKIIFLLTGCMTMAMGILFWFLIPDNQLNARFLNEHDRKLAILRIRKNEQGVGNKHFKMYQFKEALTDPLTWAFVFYSLVADIPNGGISNFFSILITSFGYTSEQSLLYGTPGGAVEIITLVFCGWLSQRFGRRIPFAMIFLGVAIVGIVLMVAVPKSHPTGRLAGYYLTQASPAPFVALLSLISTNVAGYTKKTTVGALYLIGYCIGNIIGPQTFQAKDAPLYTPAKITIIVCWVLCMFDLAFIWWYCASQNKKKAAIRASPEYIKIQGQEFLDLTDRENPEFSYVI